MPRKPEMAIIKCQWPGRNPRRHPGDAQSHLAQFILKFQIDMFGMRVTDRVGHAFTWLMRKMFPSAASVNRRGSGWMSQRNSIPVPGDHLGGKPARLQRTLEKCGAFQFFRAQIEQ